MPFDCVGNRSVDERECIGVLAQRGCRISVTESGLGLKDLAAFDEERGHVVSKAVQRRAFDARPAGKACESVSERAGGESASVVEIGTEQPRSERVAGTGCRSPLVLELVPQHRRRRADRECSISTRFRCSDRVGGRGPADVQDAVSEVVELKRCEFAASRTAVARKSHQHEVLLGEMPVLMITWSARVVCDSLEATAPRRRRAGVQAPRFRVGGGVLARAGPRMVRIGWVSMIRSS